MKSSSCFVKKSRLILRIKNNETLRSCAYRSFQHQANIRNSAVARVSEAPPEISRGAPHTLLAYYYELQ